MIEVRIARVQVILGPERLVEAWNLDPGAGERVEVGVRGRESLCLPCLTEQSAT